MAGISDWCTGVTIADVNGDGLLDIYVCSVQGEHELQGRNELFINNGNGLYRECRKIRPRLISLVNTGSFFDYDHDGAWIVLY